MTTREIPYIKNVELTSYCNLNCPICVEKTWKREHINLELLETILSKNAKVFEGQAVWLHYRGEPLLHPHLEETIALFDTYKVRTRLSTNGLLLTPQKIEALLHSPLEGLVVSAITDDAAMYKKLRGADKYAVVNANIENLIAAHKAYGSKTKIQVMGLDYGQGAAKIDGFVKHYNDLGIEVSIHLFSNRVNQSRYHPATAPHTEPKRLPCNWLFNGLVILSNGDVTTCYFDLSTKLVVCNLRDYDYSILDVWNSSTYRQMRSEHENDRFEGACKNCTDWIYEHPDIAKEHNTFVKIYPKKHD